ncbi:hypothetical protein Ddc_14685 [Ditylenchus destructor]|nr:hypothetical protein Ddc_14685 [Ditylenchus destructor]
MSSGWVMAHFVCHIQGYRLVYHTGPTEGGAKNFHLRILDFGQTPELRAPVSRKWPMSSGWVMAHFVCHIQGYRLVYHTGPTEGGAKNFLCESWILAKIPNFAHLYLEIRLHLPADS